ncbi:MAG: methyltransferase, TrmH family [Gaiellaceae bacterium]|nr:methyltransferase, TrmH family [Gaiellaceae bacterium]
MRKSRERRRSGLFIAEGPREVERVRAAGLVVHATYFAPELLAWDEGEEVSARVLAKMAYRAEPEGVLAVVEIPHRALPTDPTLVLVAVGIEKPGNLGAMARTADAAGVDALVLGDANVDPWNPNAIRASTGAVFVLPIIEMTKDEVASLPIRKVAAVLGARATHTEPDYSRPTAFLVGPEDAGLDDAWRAIADVSVAIPMKGAAADSLNASAAAAVLLFEAVRQRSAT